MEDTVPLPDGRRFRVKPSGNRWEIEYLHEQVVDGIKTWVVGAVKPVYDQAFWVLWELFMEQQAPQE